MTARSVAQKMGVKQGWRTHLVGAPADVVATLGLPPLELVEELAVEPAGELDYVHLFVTTQVALRDELVRLEPHLAPQGKLWVSWPKARRLGTDLTLPTVISISYDCGLVESTCLRVDDTWSGLRLTRPRPGTVYANSFGTLPGQRPAP